MRDDSVETTNIQTIYHQMWEQFQHACEHDQLEVDPYLLAPRSDTRRGITALAYLHRGDSAVLENITRFQQSVQEIEPGQYLQPREELHLTVLSVISCIAGFNLDEINIEDYTDVFNTVFRASSPIKIRYQGVSASPGCIVVQGFPENDVLNQLRENLRTQLKKASLRVSFDSRYKLITAHSSIIRFQKPLIDSLKLLELCSRYRDFCFGTLELRDFELVFNNWYQNLHETRTLAHCHLS